MVWQRPQGRGSAFIVAVSAMIACDSSGNMQAIQAVNDKLQQNMFRRVIGTKVVSSPLKRTSHVQEMMVST